MSIAKYIRDSLSQKENRYLFIILAAAAIIRIWGLSYGLPDLCLPDEADSIHAAGRLGLGSLNPNIFACGHLYIYIIFILLGGYFISLYLSGTVSSLSEFKDFYYSNPTWFYMLGRILSLAFGLLIVYMAYKIGRRLFNTRIGLVAALLVAFSPELVKTSQIVKPDTVLTGFLMICFYYSIRIMESGQRRYYLLAGVFLGLSISSKLPGVVYFAYIIGAALVFLLQKRNERSNNDSQIPENSSNLASKSPVLSFWHGILYSILATFIAVALTSPYYFLDYQGLWKIFNDVFSIHNAYEHTQSMRSLKLIPFWQRAASDFSYEGIVLVLLMTGGIAWALYRRRFLDFLPVPALFVTVLLFYIGRFHYILPFLGILYIWAARFIVEATETIIIHFQKKTDIAQNSNHSYKTINGYVVAIVTLLAIIQPAIKVFHIDYLRSKKPTPTLAREWVINNITEGSVIALENNIPAIKPAPSGVPHCGLYKILQITNYYFAYYGGTDWIERTEREIQEHDINYYRQIGCDYIIVHSDNYSRYFNLEKFFPNKAAFYRSLDSELPMVKEFAPDNCLGPTIKIYKVIPAIMQMTVRTD